MINIFVSPALAESQAKPHNGLHRANLNLLTDLPDTQVIHEPHQADVLVMHAGQYSKAFHKVADKPLIAICHGLYPTFDFIDAQGWASQQNEHVLLDMSIADKVFVPSLWVQDMVYRHLRVEAEVLTWGVNVSEWTGNRQTPPYVLWNKNRADAVCNPYHMNQIAKHLPEVQFVSTYGDAANNVKVIGGMPYEKMKAWVQGASVYLATTKETGDIGSKEALACGVPVVCFRQGATPEFIEHGFNGLVVAPNDYAGAAQAIQYILAHWEVMSANALASAKGLGWEQPRTKFLRTLKQLASPLPKPDVSVVIPHHNYGEYVGQAIESVLNQQTDYSMEVIVVDDASTDKEALATIRNYPVSLIEHPTNLGVAEARNTGTVKARSDLVLYLDADDLLAPTFIQQAVALMRSDKRLGIVHSQIAIFNGETVWKGEWLTKPFNRHTQIMNQDNQLPTCSLVRRADVLRVGGFRKELTPAEDADLLTRLSAFTGKRVHRIEEPLFIYRIKPNSLLQNHLKEKKVDPYTLPQPWHKNKPAFAIGRGCNPIWDVDNPVVRVEGATLEQLVGQTFTGWTQSYRYSVPFVLQWKGERPLDYLESLFKNYLQTGALGDLEMACCGGVITPVGTAYNESDWLLAVYTGEELGWKTRLSPTRQLNPSDGRVVEYRYRKGSTLRIHNKDLPLMGALWEVKPQSEVLVLEPVIPTELPQNEPPTISPSHVSVNTDANNRTPTVQSRGKVKGRTR